MQFPMFSDNNADKEDFITYQANNSNDFIVSSFNCHGLKSSAAYAQELFNNSNILFLCEHWLKEGELSHMNEQFDNAWSNLKSSMDACTHNVGRPFGGCGFLCRKSQGVNYRTITCISDRLSGIEVIVNQKSVLCVFGVYLPYDSHDKNSFDMYLDTLNELQGLLDNCTSVPHMVVGDFNTRLPWSKTLKSNWYNCNTYGKRSAVLYDFICENELYVANFSYDQAINYTYHNAAHKSYIDHMLLPVKMSENVKSCYIMDSSHNVSDHNALQCVISINLPMCNQGETITASTLIDWMDPLTQEAYASTLKEQLVHKPIVDVKSVTSADEAANAINTTYDLIQNAVHNAAESVSVVRSTHVKRKKWWNDDCAYAKYKTGLFHKIWKDLGKPTTGQAYLCYKAARKHYRKTCRNAVNVSLRSHHSFIDSLYRATKHRELWNIIKKHKKAQTNYDLITDAALENHFRKKFSTPTTQSEYILNAETLVQEELLSIDNTSFPDLYISEAKVITYIKRLKAGSSAGVDNMKPEHLKFSLGTQLTLHISALLTLCLRYGLVPECFRSGLLVPILKKSHLDGRDPANYRPITISVVLSKLLEYCILEDVADFKMDPFQFGFVKNSGTNTAISLAHDVSSYCNARGTTTYLCSLDAEGAFDAIPHSILFMKARVALPPAQWRLMHNWYKDMSVQIRWNRKIGPSIPVCRGTRQGGLSSPFLFNIFYKDLIHLLRESKCGITIDGSTYNVYCYADDILLSSTTPSGLQRLIDIANGYITQQGLRFNPLKTTCMTFGKATFCKDPAWTIQGTKLQIVDSMSYLGAALSKDGGTSHTQSRIKAAMRAFHSLQHSGIHYNGASPDVAAHIYRVGIQTILSYGCETLHLNVTNLKQLQSAEGKIVKAFLGLYRSSHTSPLLDALNITPVRKLIALQGLNLLRSSMINAAAAKFYLSLITEKKHWSKNTLVHRIHTLNGDIDTTRYIVNNDYCSRVKHMLKLKTPDGASGITDTIREQFTHYNDGARTIVNSIVSAFM